MDIRKILALALIQNELGGYLSLAFKFSDADGVRTGKSGYSFGRSQFDLLNNPAASDCLRECGFTEDEIGLLVSQAATNSDMTRFNERLRSAGNPEIISRYDEAQLEELIRHTRAVVSNAGLTLADEEAFVHLADYHNQFFINYGGKCVAYMQRLGRAVTSHDVLDYKLTTLWGRKAPSDVRRRWQNIHRLCAGV